MSLNKPDPENKAPNAHDAENRDQTKSAPVPTGSTGGAKRDESMKDEAARHNDERPQDESSGPVAGHPKRSEEKVDEALEDTFPASDPPSFNRTTGAGRS